MNPKVAFGKPVIAGTRIAVEFILELLSAGWSVSNIVKEYPQLKKDDILACVDYAKELVQETTVYPLSILKDPKMLKKLHADLSR